MFGDYVKDVKQLRSNGEDAEVEFSFKYSEKRKTYDLVVAAGGLYSKIGTSC